DPADPDPADAAGHGALARPVHLRDQCAAVLDGGDLRQRLPRRRLLVGPGRRDPVHAAVVGAVVTADEKRMNIHNLSIEFFPPKTAEGADKLRATREKLAALNPQYYSVTFGAGGSTQQGTLDTVLEIRREGREAAPHISCMGNSADNLRALLEQY